MKHWTQALTKPYTLLAAVAIVTIVAISTMNLRADEGDTLVYETNPQRTISYDKGSVEIPSLTALDGMFAEIAEYASEAVVHISVRKAAESQFSAPTGGDGSGFIYTEDGWIVTNDHVINGADKVTVVLADGRELEGEVLAAGDLSLDIALVKVDAKNLPTLKLADSNKVAPGRFAIAVGSPFGLENTVTIGHVSAIGRPGQASDGRQAPRQYSGMIQTDASINPGNSGGPLIDVHGDVIGVNTSIFSLSGSSSGIGFAIPSNVVRVVADELIQKGSFDRGLMGLVPRDLKPYEQKDTGISGAYVNVVSPGDPADKAGMQAGDIITKVNGSLVNSEIDLRVALYKLSPSDTVKVEYFRDGSAMDTELKLIEPQFQTAPPQVQEPRNPGFGNGEQFRDIPQRRPTLGVSLYDVDDTQREQYGLAEGIEGAVVYSVRRDSVANRAGILEGDVITQVAGRKVKKAEDVVRALQGLSIGDRVEIRYVRMDGSAAREKTVTVRL